jgi:hypothetical protein
VVKPSETPQLKSKAFAAIQGASLNMLMHHAQSVSVEAGLVDMLTRMQPGRFKVFKHLKDWWEESPVSPQRRESGRGR